MCRSFAVVVVDNEAVDKTSHRATHSQWTEDQSP